MRANQKSRLAAQESAVSDTVGSILLVAITVLMAGALGVMMFSVAKPAERVSATLTARIDPGGNGWGNGDEVLRITHGGGDAVQAAQATVIYDIGGTVTRLKGATNLASAFSDGALTIGESWTKTLLIPPDITVRLQLVGETNDATTVLAAVSAATDCSGDASPPIVTVISQVPSDVTTATNQAVTISVYLTDTCQGVDTSVVPSLEYRLNDGTDPAYLSAGAMTPSGTNNWTGAIPIINYNSHGNKILEYRLNPVTDLGGCCNGPSSPALADVIDDLSSYTFVASASPVGGAGTITGVSALNAFDGVFANLTETAFTTTPNTVGPTTLSGTAASAAGTTTGLASAALAANESSNSHIILDDGGSVSVSGFSATSAATVLSLSIGFEGRASGAGPDPAYTLRFTTTGCTDSPPTPAPTMSQTTDTRFVRNVTSLCAWTATNIAAMSVSVAKSNTVNRDIEVDHVFVVVKYRTSSQAYNMTIQLNFGPLPTVNVTSHTLQLRYQSFGETFNVRVFDGSVWNLRGSSLVQAGIPGTYAYTLVGNEITGGVGGTGPKIRVVDSNAANGQASSIIVDYARVLSQ